jgi:hypothetical protein
MNIGGLRKTEMIYNDDLKSKLDDPLNYNNNVKEQYVKVKEQDVKVKEQYVKVKEQDVINSKMLTEEFIKQLLNSKKYQDKCIKEKEYVEQHKNFKTVQISPTITYNVFDEEKIIDMIPPVGMSMDDY